ncbi:hypothetical protein ACE6H2_006939 [Prunus campanulata]
MEMATVSSSQGDDKYVTPIENQKCAKTCVGHLISSGMDFSGKLSFCIEDFVDKAEETSLEGSPRSFFGIFFRLRGQSWSPLLVSWSSGSRKLEVVVGVWLELL